MSLSKLNENLNNHQSLPDQPSLTAQELKILFDKAGNDIKTYINNVLTEEIDTLISNIQSGKIDVNKIINNLTTGGANNVASAETVKQLNNSKLNSNANAVSASKIQTARNISLDGAVRGNADFDGSTDVTINTTLNNIAVLTGTIPNTGTTGTRAFARNFPEGFNRDNCIVVSYSVDFVYSRYFEIVKGANLQKSISFTNDNKIKYSVQGVSDKVDYKIVLMKI